MCDYREIANGNKTLCFSQNGEQDIIQYMSGSSTLGTCVYISVTSCTYTALIYITELNSVTKCFMYIRNQVWATHQTNTCIMLVSNDRKYVHDTVTVCLHENTVCSSYCQHATKHHYMKDGTTVMYMYSYGSPFHDVHVPWLGSRGLCSPRGAP